MNEHGDVPIKLYLQKQGRVQIGAVVIICQPLPFSPSLPSYLLSPLFMKNYF
jgi:hypothetical protein